MYKIVYSGAYFVQHVGGMSRLLPDESTIGDNVQTIVPNLLTVSQNCAAYLPSQSTSFFEQGDVTFLHINARSLHSSHSDIVSFVHKENHVADFLLISETWLHPSLTSNYSIPGYELFHAIPENCITGKGCAIYVKKSYFQFCSMINHLCANQVEFQSIFLLVSLPGRPSFIVATVYRSPSYSSRPFLDYLEDCLYQLNLLNKSCFWGGDWNLNLFKCNDQETKSFMNCLNSFGFYPTVSVASRVGNTPPYNESLIDNIVTNNLPTVTHSGSICAGIADHLAIFCSARLIKKSGCQTECSRTLPSKINYDRIEELKANIANCLTDFQNIDNPDMAAEKITTVIIAESEKFKVQYSSRRFSPIQPWMTPGLLRSISKRNKLLKEFLNCRSSENLNKFRKYRNSLRLAMRHAKKAYYRNQFEKNSQNPKHLWADLLQAAQIKTHSQDLPDRFEVGGKDVDNPTDIADLFNKYFAQVAPSLEKSLGPSFKNPISYMSHIVVPDVMTFRPVTEDNVMQIAASLKDASAGLDNITSKLVKSILPSILTHVTYLVNLCLSKNVFPNIFKTALITPVFKAGSRSQFSNYRPISVLSVFSKILEKIMFQQLTSFIFDNNILYEYQFGFRSKHSTYMPIALLHDHVTSNLAKGNISTSIYLDLARAFDTVNIDILLAKLKVYGISGDSLVLLKSYLSERSHILKYKGITSGPQEVTCGVPQGSVLGPLLFLLYINDLSSVSSEAKFLLFADDTAIFYTASSINNLQASVSVSFPKILEWLHSNRLSLSASKTFYQIFSPSTSLDGLSIMANNTHIKRAQTVKYLGVLVDEDLRFKSHIEKVSSIVSRNLGIISRARYLFDRKQVILLYNALILPYFTYCLVTWGSNYESSLQPLIVLQKRAIRLVAGTGRIAHTGPLFRELRLLKITDLLQYQLLLVLHDFLHGHLPWPLARRFHLYHSARNLRGNIHFCETVHTDGAERLPNYKHRNYILFNLFYQAPRVWNRTISPLIPDIRDIPSSKSHFKKYIKVIFIDSYYD